MGKAVRRQHVQMSILSLLQTVFMYLDLQFIHHFDGRSGCEPILLISILIRVF
jgi:hypothetical protein